MEEARKHAKLYVDCAKKANKAYQKFPMRRNFRFSELPVLANRVGKVVEAKYHSVSHSAYMLSRLSLGIVYHQFWAWISEPKSRIIFNPPAPVKMFVEMSLIIMVFCYMINWTANFRNSYMPYVFGFIVIFISFISVFSYSVGKVNSWFSAPKNEHIEKRDYYCEALSSFIGVSDACVDPAHFSIYSRMKKSMPYIIGGLATFGAVAIAYKLSRSKKIQAPRTENDTEELQTEEKKNGSSPSVRIVPKGTNIYSNVMHSRPSVAYSGEPKELHDLLSQACSRLARFIFPDNRVMHTRVCGVKGEFALVNLHSIPQEGTFNVIVFVDPYLEKEDIPVNLKAEQYREIMIVFSRDCFDLGNDVALIRLAGFSFRNVLKHISQSHDKMGKGYASGQEVNFLLREEKTEIDCSNTAYKSNIFLKPCYFAKVVGHRQSHCGRHFITAQQKGAVWAGIHTAGMENNDEVFFSPINKSSIEKAIDRLSSQDIMMPVFSENERIFVEGDFSSMRLPNSKSIVHYTNLRSVEYFGKMPGDVLASTPSDLERNSFSCEILEEMKNAFKVETFSEFGIPKMKDFKLDGEVVSPVGRNFEKMTRVKAALPIHVLERAVDILLRRYAGEVLRLNPDRKICPLPFREVINGCLEDDCISRMRTNTGAGFQFPGKKEKYLPLRVGSSDQRYMTEYAMERVLRVLKAYRNSERAHIVYQGLLKDEPRLLEKCRIGKTRMFYSMPLDACIVAKHVLGPISGLMMEHNEIFNTAVGIDMHSRGGHLYESIINHSRNVFAGDFGGFDLTMPFSVRWIMSTVFYKIGEIFGYNKNALQILQGVLSDALFPFIEVKKDIFCVPGLDPSGSMYTVDQNGIANDAMQVLCWIIEPSLNEELFFKKVYGRNTGDDVFKTVSGDVAHLFNNQTFSKFCHDFLRMEYTSSDKGEIDSPFEDPETCTFLKRTFPLHVVSGRRVAALDVNSIARMITWRGKSTVTEMEQIRDVFIAALWESFFHLREHEYESLRSLLMKIYIREYEWNLELSFPSYSYLYERFFHKCPPSKAVVEEELPRSDESDAEDCCSLNGVTERSLNSQEATLHELGLAKQKIRSDSIIFESLEGKSEAVDMGLVEKTETFTDIIGQEATVSNYGREIPIPLITRTLHAPSEFFERPVQISAFATAFGEDFDVQFNPWNVYLKDASVRAKLRNYLLLKADLCVRIEIAGNPFDYGRMIVSYVPFSSFNATWISGMTRSQMLRYVSSMIGTKTMDPKENKPLTLRIPFISPQPSGRLCNNDWTPTAAASDFTDFSELGQLNMSSLVYFRTTAASSSPPYVYVYAWMENVELGPITSTTMPLAESEFTRGPVERMSSNAASVMAKLTSVPVIGPYAKASQMVFSGISQMSSLFGWSYPTVPVDASRVRMEPFQNPSVTIGRDTGHRLTFDPKQELRVDGSCVGVLEDELDISHLCAKESLVEQFLWSPSSPILVPLWTAGVCPSTCDIVPSTSDVGTGVPSPMGLVSTCFGYWRGSITYRIEVCSNSFIRGKFLIAYEPNIRLCPVTSQSLNRQYIKIVDIQETTDVEFTVHWNYRRSWARVPHVDSWYYTQGENFNSMALDPECFNGAIYISPLTLLQTPDSTSPIVINVWTRSSDMMFNQFTPDTIPLTTNFTGPDHPGSLLEDKEEKIPVAESRSDKDVTVMDLNESSSVLRGISEDHFGEQPISLRSFLKRFFVTANYTLEITDTGQSQNALQAIFPIFPGVSTNGADLNGLYYLLRPCFLGQRGGMRKRVLLSMVGQPGYQDSIFVRTNGLELTSSPALSFTPSYLARYVAAGSTMFLPFTNGGVEFELPYYSNNLFSFSMATDPYQGSSNLESYASRRYLVGLNQTNQVIASNAGIYEFSAAGEDFTFLRWVGCPRIIVPIATPPS